MTGSRSGPTFGSRIRDFYFSLNSPAVPTGVQVMNPYADARVRGYVRQFLDRYFSDCDSRLLVFGINPGRFGAGVTGVTFTDPVVLSDVCGIGNHLPRRRELSSVFIYEVIAHMGGPASFYRGNFLTALSPLGFMREGKNLNFYDDRSLERQVTPFIVESIARQIAAGGRRDSAVILGAGKNADFMQRLNEKHAFFGSLHVLEHPRFIMQYRRKRMREFVERYAEVLTRTGNLHTAGAVQGE